MGENLTPEDIQAYTKIINKCPALCEYTKIQERLDSLLEEFDGLDKQIEEIDFTLSSLKERLSEMQEPERKMFIFKMSWPDLKALAKEMSISTFKKSSGKNKRREGRKERNELKKE